MINQVSSPDSNFSSGNFFYFVIKHWKTITLVAIISCVLAILFSSPIFITPKYKGKVILFPASTSSVSKTLMSSNNNQKDVMEIGEEEQSEQLLQVLNSTELRNIIINKFDLKTHYNITGNNSREKTYKSFKENIHFNRTEFGAIEISVLDTDPKLAAKIANTISEQLDTIKNKIHQDRAQKAFEIIDKEYISYKQYVTNLEDSLSLIMKHGVFDYESQSEMLNRQLAVELAKGNQGAINRLEEKLTVLAKYGGAYLSIRDALLHDKLQLSLIKVKYDEAKMDATQNLPQKFVIDRAFPSEKKAYPIRWLIIISVMLSSIIATVIICVFIEGVKKEKNKLK
ncbi:MAG: Wzz/FepE/Etk N-terminal domain-containing protein [Bacteroidales bacterium]